MVLIYISLMADDTEHSCWLFVGLYVVFGEIAIQVFHLFNWLACFPGNHHGSVMLFSVLLLTEEWW